MSDKLQRARAKREEWRRNPMRFVHENFHVEPDAWQVDALTAYADPAKQRIALQSCAGPGKSAVLAWCGWHFLVCQGTDQHHPAGYALSITGDNLRDNLWKEFAVWRNRSEFLTAHFEWQKEIIFNKHHPETWWIRARTWSKTADAEAQGRTLSGLHSRYVLYLPDESGEIAPAVLRAAEQGLSNCSWGKIVQAGNPTSHDGMLYASVTGQSNLWTVIRITGDPDNPKRSSRIDTTWARDQIDLYGRDNPWVMAYILGVFPPGSLNALLGPDEVRAAMGRSVNEDDYQHVQKRIGVDVARFGDDRTVLFPRQGLAAFPPVTMRHQRSHDIAARLMEGKYKWGSELEFIDDTGGWGAGTIDACLLAGVSLVPVNFSSDPIDPRYFNKRSELYFLGAEWVKRGGSLPDGLDAIVREATSARYWFENGKFRVEEKNQVKKRLGFSPDLWDALLTTFAYPEMPGSLVGSHAESRPEGGLFRSVAHHEGGVRGMLSDYNPLDQIDNPYGHRGMRG